MIKLSIILVCLVFFACVIQEDATEKTNMPWDIEKLSNAPQVFHDPEHSTEKINAVFYAGVPWQGNPTRVFAYYGIPDVKENEKVPAMVLVHGGGGSAFLPWVRLWVSRGYAAIAMDTCGHISGGGYNNHSRHDYSGPSGWSDCFDQIDQPIEDQWTFHAVADVILAHSLIRSLPQVDLGKVGLTGISWGGYLACLVAAVDDRFSFAAPVYGCGFLGDDSAWLAEFERIGSKNSGKWLKLWDPSEYLHLACMPMLWISGSNDFAYPLNSFQKSYRLTEGDRHISVRLRMPHGHGGPGENPEEIFVLAESLFRKGVPLAKIIDNDRDDLHVWVRYESAIPIIKAELNYTTDHGKWQDRAWRTVPATLDKQYASALLPKNATVYYFNLIDNRDLVISTEHEEMIFNRL